MKKDLSHRAQVVLAAVISNFIKTAGPVGSRTIAKLDDIDISPATIRNVMADLEDLGLLRQPHVSAGRVPTQEGLRFYVDSILEVRELNKRAKAQIRQALSLQDFNDVNEVLKSTSKTLSGLSQQVAVVAAPGPEKEVFRHIEFILLKPGLILVVFVSMGGAAQNRIIESETDLTQEDLDKFTRYLNDLLADLTLSEVRERVAAEMAQEKVRFNTVLSRALKLGQKALGDGKEGDLFIEGQTNLMVAPEFNDVARLRQIFRAFEEKSTLLRLLEKAILAQGVQLFIGAESDLAELEGLSIVTSSYGGDKAPLGALGVIGPTRMDYSKVIPMVDYTAKLVSRILDERS
ncbi:MAG: heat-inducible transcriptional repressor HrcA [Desulfarculaceae bacterium]